VEATEQKTPRKRATRKKAVEADAVEEIQETAPVAAEETSNATPDAEAEGSLIDARGDDASEIYDEEDDVIEDQGGEEDLLEDDYDEVDDLEEDEDNLVELENDGYEGEDFDEEGEAEEDEGARLTHLDSEGRAQMVDISSKPVTARTAIATGYVRMAKKTLDLLENQSLPKGDALTVAEVAGIMAAKRASDLIPLCHPLALTNVAVHCEVTPGGVLIRSEAATQAQTGVEMEALTAASVAALTLYDMCKGVDAGIVISDIRLNSKTGGVSGNWQPAAATEAPPAEADYGSDEVEMEDEEEQITPRSIPQPEPSRPAYRREGWTGTSRPAPRPYDREGDQRGGYGANRTGSSGSSGSYGSGYNRDRGSSYGNRPTNRPAPSNSGPSNSGPSNSGPSNYGANRDRSAPGGYNRDRGTGGYSGNKPGYGYGSGGSYNRDRTPYSGRQDNRSGGTYGANREGTNRDRTTGGYPGSNYRPGGQTGYNRDRGTGNYPPNKPGFAGFRDRNRDRENE